MHTKVPTDFLPSCIKAAKPVPEMFETAVEFQTVPVQMPWWIDVSMLIWMVVETSIH